MNNMAAEYKLSLTAEEIDKKLNKDYVEKNQNISIGESGSGDEMNTSWDSTTTLSPTSIDITTHSDEMYNSNIHIRTDYGDYPEIVLECDDGGGKTTLSSKGIATKNIGLGNTNIDSDGLHISQSRDNVATSVDVEHNSINIKSVMKDDVSCDTGIELIADTMYSYIQISDAPDFGSSKSRYFANALSLNYDTPDEFCITANGEYSIVTGSDSMKQAWQKFLDINSTKPTIDPVFANNSWETIKWVAQNDDPSKYWSVGDYKMLDFPGFTRGDYLTYRQYSNSTATTYTWSLPKLTRTDSGASGAYSQGTIEVIDIPKFISKIKSFNIESIFQVGSEEYNAIECQFTCNGDADSTDDKKRILVQVRPVDGRNGKSTIAAGFKIVDRVTTSTSQSAIEKILENYGIEIKLNDDYDNSGYRTRYAFLTVCLGSEVIPARQYPIMWVDSHKDKVVTPADYGKSKAGLTLCLGVTRSCVEACPPYNYTDALKNNIYDLCFYVDGDGKVQQMPYISDDGKYIKSPYIYCASNPISEDENTIQTQTWSETQFRKSLQQLLDATELADMIVPVKKTTAYKLFRPNFNYLPAEITYDKVFLPSEHELNGQRFYYTGSYLDKDTEPSSSVTCGIGEEGDTYEFFHQGASRFFWNKDFLEDFSVKGINLFTRSKARQNTDKSLEASSDCCYLYSRGNTFKNAGLKYTGGEISSGNISINLNNPQVASLGTMSVDHGLLLAKCGYSPNVGDTYQLYYTWCGQAFNGYIFPEGGIVIQKKGDPSSEKIILDGIEAWDSYEFGVLESYGITVDHYEDDDLVTPEKTDEFLCFYEFTVVGGIEVTRELDYFIHEPELINATNVVIQDTFYSSNYYNGPGTYEYIAVTEGGKLVIRLSHDGTLIGSTGFETWSLGEGNVNSEFMGLFLDGEENGNLPYLSEETTFFKFELFVEINASVGAEVDKVTLTVDNDLTDFVTYINSWCSDFKEPIGVYDFTIEGDGEDVELSGGAQIRISKDGILLEGGDGIIAFPAFHLENITPDFTIEGTLTVTGSVAYEPLAGDVEGYILPMFCM